MNYITSDCGKKQPKGRKVSQLFLDSSLALVLIYLLFVFCVLSVFSTI